jgi:hypothetical protein
METRKENMFKKIKNYIVLTLASLTLSMPVAFPAIVNAAPCSSIGNSINSGINSAVGSNTGCGTGGNLNSGVGSIAKTVVNLFSVIVGIISVIMIIYAGFRYVTSGGDSNNVSGAKNTLVYAIVGLVIVAIAQLIVHYVLNSASGIGSTTAG